MKKNILFWGLFLLVISCNTSPRKNNASEEPKEDKVVSQPESIVLFDSTKVIWKYSYNYQMETFEMTKVRPVDSDTLTGETLENIINNAWPKIKIKFVGISNDTAYISIPESAVLTQQMGSAGAESFMISTTWTFTELKGIRYVAYDFAYGDHAMPGVYSRKSWEKNKDH